MQKTLEKFDLDQENQKDLFSIFYESQVFQWGFVLVFFTIQVSIYYFMDHIPPITKPHSAMSPMVVKERPIAAWNADIAKILSFGHSPLFIDILWLKTIVNESLFSVPEVMTPLPLGRSQLYYDLDLLVQLDPAFLEVYLNGANLLAVTRKDMIGARDLLLKGIQYFQTHQTAPLGASARNYSQQLWRLYLLLGYIELFDLKNMQNASLVFQDAAKLPGAPAYLEQLARRLERPGGEYEVGLRLLKFLSDSAPDQKVKRELEEQRLRLYQGQFLFEVNLAFNEFVQTQPSQPSTEDANKAEQKLRGFWREFVRTTHTPKTDPWGGLLSLGRNGKIVSTTPYEPVFGLE